MTSRTNLGKHFTNSLALYFFNACSIINVSDSHSMKFNGKKQPAGYPERRTGVQI